MTFKQRAASLTLARFVFIVTVVALLLSSLLLAGGCSAPATVSDQIEGCPALNRHVDLHVRVLGPDGAEVDGRDFTLTLAAQSYDPEYQGILINGVGVSGRNPYVADRETEYDPVICIPDERAVAVMVRASLHNPDVAYEVIECELIDQGVIGEGVAGGPLGHNPTALGRVALDQARVELTDVSEALSGPDRYVIAQCDYLHVPGGFTGQVPELFPRPLQ